MENHTAAQLFQRPTTSILIEPFERFAIYDSRFANPNHARNRYIMKTKLLLPVIVSSFCLVHPAFSQGSLTPPGAPAPTMKSLDQIEARTPISSAPFTITQPGSYYLTTNVTVSSGYAIAITANNVTLDLNGFTIASTAPVASGDTAILLSGSLTNLAIRNGHISSGVTNNGAGVYSGSGFGYGVAFSGFPYNVRVSGVSVCGCQYFGIYLGYNSTVVEACVVNTVGAYGIQAQSVTDSTSNDCGTAAISANTANNCIGSASGSGAGVYATNANNCYGNSAGDGDGVHADGNALNCYGQSSSGIGVDAYGTAENCYGYSGSGTGVSAATAQNCYGYSNSGVSGTGLFAAIAQNCTGQSITGPGVWATGVALNCYGLSSSGYGVDANNAQNCEGRSNTGTGVHANSAQNCDGHSNGSGTGVSATIATGCHGFSGTGTGLSAFIANGCHGETFSGTTLSATHNVNSY
jgi:hypothetical protein